MEKNKIQDLQRFKKMTFRIAKKKPKAKAYRVTFEFSVNRFHESVDELQQNELSVKEGYDEESDEEFQTRKGDWLEMHASFGNDVVLLNHIRKSFDLEEFMGGFMDHTIDSIEWSGDNRLTFMVYPTGPDQFTERELREELQNHPLEMEEYMSDLDNGWVTHTEITGMPYAYLDYRENPIKIESIYEGGRKRKTRKRQHA
jgi:hypothetical protein